jgi:hypothetical protein
MPCPQFTVKERYDERLGDVSMARSKEAVLSASSAPDQIVGTAAKVDETEWNGLAR